VYTFISHHVLRCL